jgi:hypothetical protein
VHRSSTMASSVVKKRSDGKRPFRLLNLDKSLRAQKMMCDCPFLESCTQLTPSHSAATNAAISPLLLLPPEIRCRIYDYAFGGFVVHLGTDDGPRKQVLLKTLCQSPQTCASLQFQHRDSRVLPGSETSLHQCTTFKAAPRSERITIPVHMLQVCRQIYHEAVLKPFAQTTFHFATSRLGSRAATMFLEELVPEQVRSIASLCVVSLDSNFMSRPLILKFKGLKHLDIHLMIFYEHIRGKAGIKELKNLGLKSLRFTASLRSHNNEASLLEWIRLQEIEILSKQQPMLTAD